VKYKLLLFTYKAIHGTTGPYLSELISIHHPLKNLRSNKGITIQQVKTRTSFGDRSFSAAAPKLGNQLPLSLRCKNHTHFNDTLKHCYLMWHINSAYEHLLE
jgi:hypothetical protein